MENYLYAPILRFKRGELKAIDKLKDDIKNSLLPIFVVNSDDYSEASLKLLPDKFMLETDSDDTFNEFKKFCNHNDKQIIKVYNDTTNIKTDEEFCLHITMDDDLPEINIDTENGYLIIDFEEKKFRGASLNIALETFKPIVEMKWKKVFFAGSSIPNNLPKEQTPVERYEFNVLYKAAKNKWDFVGFSDYGITGLWSDPDVPIKYLRPAAKIRYTCEDKFLLIKGQSLKKAGGEQYTTLSNTVVNSGYFKGPDYSWGDSFIKECSDKSEKGEDETKNGNLETWVTVDTNHHITSVVKQLSNPV